MNCTQSRLLLHARVDGELDAANSLELERHLKTCPACSTEVKSLQSLRQALQTSGLHFTAPESLKTDLRQFVRDMHEPGIPRQPGFQWPWPWLTFGATVAALLLLVLRPAGLSEHDAWVNEVVTSHVRSLQVEHLTDVASSDQHTVKPWFDGKLDFAPDVKDFVAQGFPLIGGRLDYLHGRTVAALVYRHNKHLINVYVWPAGNDPFTDKVETIRGYSLIQHTANGANYSLISDLNAKELGELAALLGH